MGEGEFSGFGRRRRCPHPRTISLTIEMLRGKEGVDGDSEDCVVNVYFPGLVGWRSNSGEVAELG